QSHERGEKAGEAQRHDKVSTITSAHRRVPLAVRSICHPASEVRSVNDGEKGVFETMPPCRCLGSDGINAALSLVPFVTTVRVVGPVTNQTGARLVADAEVVIERLHAVKRQGAACDFGKFACCIDG